MKTICDSCKNKPTCKDVKNVTLDMFPVLDGKLMDILIQTIQEPPNE